MEIRRGGKDARNNEAPAQLLTASSFLDFKKNNSEHSEQSEHFALLCFWNQLPYTHITMRPSTLTSSLRALNRSLPRTTISRATARPFSYSINRLPSSSSTQLRRPQRLPIPFPTFRYNSSSSSASNPLTDRAADAQNDAQHEEQNRLRREQEPAYQITFTCKPCGERSSHRMSKHGYHKGTVLIRCPSCHNRHVISDHLNIFFDKKTTLEDILQKDGRKVTRGVLDGDMEFWDDGVAHKREKSGPTDSGSGQS